MSDRALRIDDIVDLRAYERERESFRAEVIELKRLRRVPIGPLVTVVFENRTTMRFQVQEMARAEAMMSDDKIQAELDIYNSLIPGPGELRLTMFVELTSDEELRTWLPRLVGIERAVQLQIGEVTGGESGAGSVEIVPAAVEAAHEAQLTREEMTASVHYVGFSLDEAQRERFVAGHVSIAIAHPEYRHETMLSRATCASLAGDW